MKNTQTKTIASYKRLSSSVNGNPRFQFAFEDGTTATSMSDAGFAYGVGNQDLREGSRVEVEYTRAGNIRWMKPTVESCGHNNERVTQDGSIVCDDCGATCVAAGVWKVTA